MIALAKLGAAVIGLRMGASHVRGYVANLNVEVRSVCDLDAARAAAVAKQFNVPHHTTDYRDCIRQDGVDVVSVATPDPLHAEHSIAALEAGKHVLCEKPLALTIEDCEAMVRAADRSGKKFMIGQVCRYAPGFRLAKRLVDDGLIGRLFFVESEYAHDYTNLPGVGGWRVDPQVMREPFIGGACHAVDLLRWIAGDADEVFAYSNRFVLTDWPVDDCTIACIRFKSGVIGKAFCSVGCKRPYTMRSVFYGDEGTIISDNTSPEVLVYSRRYVDTLAFAK
ncbi:MAG: Gfo/Idh/MocA family protein, partial [Armatimonadota bacterium]